MCQDYWTAVNKTNTVPCLQALMGSRERDTHGYSCAAALPVETGSQAKWGANNLGFGGGLPESVMLMLNLGGGVNTS